MGDVMQMKNGKYVPAEPLGYCCEFGEAKNNGNCDCDEGAFYKRLPNDCDGSSWDDEPIFLCKEHSVGHEPYVEE